MTDSYNPAASFTHGDFPEARRANAIAGWFAALTEGDAASRRYLLLLRFAVLNVVALALFGAAWLKGWVALILAGDSTHQVLLIAAVFAYGLVRCGRQDLHHQRRAQSAQRAAVRRLIAGAEISGEHPGARRPVAGDQRLGAQDEAPVRGSDRSGTSVTAWCSSACSAR